MKKILIIVAITVLFGSFAVFGQCSPVPFGHSYFGILEFSPVDNGSAFDGTFWTWDADGDGNAYETSIPLDEWYYPLGDSSAYVWGIWGNYAANEGVSACEDLDDPFCAVFGWVYNEGYPNHSAEYAVIAVDYNLSRNSIWDFDDLNGGIQSSADWPYITGIQNAVFNDGTVTCDIQWSAATANYEETASIDAPDSLIKGYKVYYQNSTHVPATCRLEGSNWKAAVNAVDGDTVFKDVNKTSASVKFPAPSKDQAGYLAVGLVFEDNSNTSTDGVFLDMVGENSYAGPHSAGIRIERKVGTAVKRFSGKPMNSNAVKLEWTTSNESKNLLGFNLYRSKNGDSYRKVNKKLVYASGYEWGDDYKHVDSLNNGRDRRKIRGSGFDASFTTSLTLEKSMGGFEPTPSGDDSRIYYKLELVDRDGSSKFAADTDVNLSAVK